MKKGMKKLEDVYAAAAFAEAGEFETARQIAGEIRPERRERLNWFERVMTAVTFAEAGEHETARDIMRQEKRPQKRDRTTPGTRKQLRAPGIKR
ncbi:MAG TPA: hypothetical protein ENG83_15120 [Nitrospirae bacterium]|nr:hypothetical protein BMS3Abin06_00937 [bacterium BMS3Abin06]HDH13500.1 hypothetical protein [Nitrospirota bacterium]HDZ01060.1 hypothetical protein [Nitrospirota bacterium]